MSIQTHKKAIVTGASRGIGKAIALELAHRGYDLAICCVHSTGLLDNVRQEIEACGVSCISAAADVGIYKEADRFCSQVLSQWGTVDLLVNNAGISLVGLFQDLTPDQWRQLCSSNLDSVYNCIHAVLPSMIRQKSGNILNISSVWGCVGASCEVGYSATKGAIQALTMALAKETAPSGIRVNAIACGAIDTDMNACFSKEELQDLADEIPAGRLGSPQEVAHFAADLIETSSYLTGQVIKLDGGWI